VIMAQGGHPAITATANTRSMSSDAIAQVAVAHPPSFSTRFVEAGHFLSNSTDRRGRAINSPLQFGHRPASTWVVQYAQNVHSKEQMRATAESGGRSALQHSQLGLSSSIAFLAVGVRKRTVIQRSDEPVGATARDQPTRLSGSAEMGWDFRIVLRRFATVAHPVIPYNPHSA
jgi:hypothetical protein